MKIAKEINGELDIVEVTTKVQIETYTKEGYELIAETDKPSDNATCHYERVTNGWVQVWEQVEGETREI
jgi:hypothetical protein